MVKDYLYLMRLHKPIGIFLLLWPTLWALWLASGGKPAMSMVFIFVAGVVLMRSAGCVINDIADRQVDKFVERTQDRPLAAGKISLTSAIILFLILLSAAFLLVLMLNRLTITLAFVGALLAIVYPFLKRITHLPQFGLGLAFAWGIPMAFAAIQNQVPIAAWMVFAASVLWPVIYDTMYAMVDRPDDVKVGVKSTAILFGKYDRVLIGFFQLLMISVLVLCGFLFHLKIEYAVALIIAAGFFIYQQSLIKNRERAACFKAFLNNHWVGLIIFAGILLSYTT